MGIDVKFVVKCQHVMMSNYTYESPTPWRELKELTNQGYEVVRSSETSATLRKVETLEEPRFYYNDGHRRFEAIQELFAKQYDHYKPWCKWNFDKYGILNDPREIQLTLNVWDEIWDDVFTILNEYEEREKDQPWNTTYDIGLASDIRSTLRKIFQYAVDHEGIQIVTTKEIEY